MPHATRPIAYVMLLMVLIHAGCTFDDDTGYYPITKRAFLLVADTAGVGKQLLLIEGNTLAKDWVQKAGMTGTLTAIASREDAHWIASANPNQVHLADPKNDRLIQSFDTGALRPDHLCAGDEYLLISDSSARRIGFLHRKKGDLITMDLPAAPGKAVYRSRKFYLQLGSRKVQILREEALAMLAEVELTRPVVDLQVDNLISILVFTRDSALYRAAIDYNTNSLSQAERPEAADKVQVSPIRVAIYGKERLSPVTLRDGRLFPGGYTGVTDFETDFFEAQVYYCARDSLFRHSISNSANQALGSLAGEIQNSFFFRAGIAD